MVLVDTSVWVVFFRKPPLIDLPAIVDLDEVVTCLPVLQEVLQGLREEAAFALARDEVRDHAHGDADLRRGQTDAVVLEHGAHEVAAEVPQEARPEPVRGYLQRALAKHGVSQPHDGTVATVEQE